MTFTCFSQWISLLQEVFSCSTIWAFISIKFDDIWSEAVFFDSCYQFSSGVVLPGDTIKFPFVFKSPNAGVFTEQWEFQTHPTVCGGAALVVTLRGVSLQEDKYKKQRSDLEVWWSLILNAGNMITNRAVEC